MTPETSAWGFVPTARVFTLTVRICARCAFAVGIAGE
jgi:hypothetical protein